MKTKTLFALGKLEIKSLNDDGSFMACASDMSVDRYDEIVDAAGWDLKAYKNNPVMLWAHDSSIPPVAKCLKAWLDGERLMINGIFAPTPFAQQLKQLAETGFLNALSVGFINKEQKENVLTKNELLEVSFVSIPANANALLLNYCEKHELDLVIKAIQNKLTKKDFAGMTAKDTKEAEKAEESQELKPQATEKGAVQDELDEEAAWEAKYQNMDSVYDIISAFYNVYFDPATPVEMFMPMLTETIGLLQQVADGTYTDPDEGAEDDNASGEVMAASIKVKKLCTVERMKDLFVAKKDGVIFTKEELEAFKNSLDEKYQIKAGQVISAKNKEIIQNAISGIEAVLPTLKELLTLDEGKGIAAGRTKNDTADNEVDDKATQKELVKQTRNAFLHSLKLLNDIKNKK